MKKYIPNTAEEVSFIARSISRLGATISAVTLISNHLNWTLTAVFITWGGNEISEYINMHNVNKLKSKAQSHDTGNNN